MRRRRLSAADGHAHWCAPAPDVPGRGDSLTTRPNTANASSGPVAPCLTSSGLSGPSASRQLAGIRALSAPGSGRDAAEAEAEAEAVAAVAVAEAEAEAEEAVAPEAR